MTTTQQVRRPLVGIALSVAAGIYLQRASGFSPLLLLSAAAFLLAAICRMERTDSLIYIACGLLAAAHGALEEMPQSSRAALAIAEVVSGEQTLAGMVADEPASSDEDGTATFLFRASEIKTESGWCDSDTVLRVYLRDARIPVLFGEQWRLTGRYTSYEKPRGGADGVLSVDGGGAEKINEANDRPAARCYQARRRAAEWLRLGVDAKSRQVHLLDAMLLGYRQAIPPELNRIFTRTGTLHIFAISGQHVVILAAILIALLKCFGISRPRWGWILIPLLFLYIFTTGMQASALRAFAMAAVFFIAPVTGRRPDAPSAIGLAAVILLAANPFYIGDPGFLLSFVVVCGLIMVHGWLIQQSKGLRLSGWDAPLKRLSGSQPLAALARYTGMLAVTSFAAWIFSAPATALFFNNISFAALVGNLAVVPLSFMVMLAGCLALLSGAFSFQLAALFNQANHLFIGLLIRIVEVLAVLPAACRTVLAPSGFVTGLWYAGLALFFSGPARWRKGAVLIFLSACLLWRAEHLLPETGIGIVRERDSVMAIRQTGNRWLLVTDGRSFSTAGAIRLLQKEGVNRIQTLMLYGKRADPEAVRRLQETFRPQETVYSESEDGVLFSDGSVRILPDR
jgi:ComEC/Rec2-related protein